MLESLPTQMSITSITVKLYKHIKICFKLVMNKQKQDASGTYTSRRKFLCCPCFFRKGSPSRSNFTEISDKNEPYDYVVEKLAIRRVPLSLFATTEDLEKQSLNLGVNPIAAGQKARQAPITLPVAAVRSSVTFSSYFKTIPRSSVENISHSTINQPEPSSPKPSLTMLIAPSVPEKELVTVNTNLQMKPQPVKTEDQEQLLVSKILNKHSSLYTLDDKEMVPKEPTTNPDRDIVVPQSLQGALARHQRSPQQSLPYRNKIQVEVHKAALPQNNLPLATLPPKKNMTPEIQQTINALGLAQKPHIPGVPPKNQKSLPVSVGNDSIEQEMCNKVLAIKDILNDSRTSYELTCQNLETGKKFRDGTKKHSHKKSKSIEGDHQTVLLEHQLKNFPFDMRFGRNSVGQQYEVGQSDKSVLALSAESDGTCYELQPAKHSAAQQYIVEQGDKACMAPSSMLSDEIQATPLNESVNTDFLTNSDHCTEISQLKGQNLKWKIIIKHHSEKNKLEDQILSETEESESEIDSEDYTSINKNLSPDR